MVLVLALMAFVLALVALVRAASLSRRLRSAGERIAELTMRVYDLEQRLGPAKPEGRPAVSEPIQPIQPPVPAIVEPAAAEPTGQPEAVAEPPEQPEATPARRDWEAVVGGNWMNKIGALVLVIGISLFLGYSLTHLGPAGKIAVGILTSVSMLGAGIALETRPGYAVFARSLIAGGWAALYFTAYAMHALPAARIVQDPWTGSAILLLVAAGMIVHSLHYRSQTITALAFGIAFVTLKLSPLSLFSVLASAPLAGALLFVAERSGWTAVAVAGVVLSYGFYALHYDPEALSGVTFRAGQAVLWSYWLMFETFDIVYASRRPGGLKRSLMPLNALGLTGVTLLSWPSGDVAQLYPFFAASAIAYAATAVARGRLYGRAEGGTAGRLLAGGQESAIAIAALLGVAAIFQRFYGLREDLALAIEAEFLVLAGVMLGERYLRVLGGAVFVLPVLKLLFAEMQSTARIAVPAGSVYEWTPLAVLLAAVFYLNRFLARSEGSPYSYAATGLAVIVLGAEVSPRYGWTALAWLIFAVTLWIAWRLLRLMDIARQSLGVSVLAWLWMWFLNVFPDWQPGPGPHPVADRVTLAAGSIVFQVAAWYASGWKRLAASLAGTALLTAALWKVLPHELVAAAWALIALALVVNEQRVAACLTAFAVFARAWAVNFPEPARVVTSAPAIAALYAGYLLLRARPDDIGRRTFSVSATGLLTVLLFYEISGRMLTVAIGTEGTLLLVAGFILRDQLLRVSGLLLFLFCILKLFLYDLRSLDAPSRILSFVVLGLFLLAASWIYTRFREQIRRLSGK